MRVELKVNGRAVGVEVEPRRTLLDCLREDVGLTGAHAGCEHGVCGACTILLDGEPARSCLMLAVQGDGYAITTIEGLSPGPGELSVLQDAFCETHASAAVRTGMIWLARRCGAHAPPLRADIVGYLRQHLPPPAAARSSRRSRSQPAAAGGERQSRRGVIHGTPPRSKPSRAAAGCTRGPSPAKRQLWRRDAAGARAAVLTSPYACAHCGL
jgi:aerobic-type carbon monoxide dehydrogenase small subunit (CoxS/CutS family)